MLEAADDAWTQSTSKHGRKVGGIGVERMWDSCVLQCPYLQYETPNIERYCNYFSCQIIMRNWLAVDLV